MYQQREKKSYSLWLNCAGPYVIHVMSELFPTYCKRTYIDKNGIEQTCGHKIFWGKTDRGKNMPFEIFTSGDYVNHFDICPAMAGQGDKPKEDKEDKFNYI